MLRAHYHAKEEREFDVDKEFINRRDTLKKRPATSSKSKGGAADKLSWEYFVGTERGNAREQGLQEKEKAYHDFLHAVNKMVGEDMSSEQLHSSAMFVYKELTADRSETDKKYDF